MEYGNLQRKEGNGGKVEGTVNLVISIDLAGARDGEAFVLRGR